MQYGSMKPIIDLKGKRILVTGGTSGIGFEIIRLLDEQGATVIIAGRSDSKNRLSIEKLTASNHFSLVLEASETRQIEPKLQSCLDQAGPVDGFVHCIGVRSRRPLNLLKPEHVTEILQTNYLSFLEITRVLAKRKNNTGKLSVVGISSVSSQTAASTLTAYAASKAALESSVRCLAKELAPKGIRLNTVIPSQINTPAYQEFLEQQPGKTDKALERQFLGLGQPRQIAEAVAFLLSDASSFISGTSIPVDGGYLSA